MSHLNMEYKGGERGPLYNKQITLIKVQIVLNALCMNFIVQFVNAYSVKYFSENVLDAHYIH